MRSKYFFPRKTLKKMAKLGISEQDIYDIFNTGQQIRGKNGMVKKYSGYEKGFFYCMAASENPGLLGRG